MVKAILFDLFETLITESGSVPTRASSLGPDLGCEREAFRIEWRAVRPHVKVGRLSFREALGNIATRLGGHGDPAVVQRLLDARMREKAELFAHIEPPVLTMIQRLRSRDVKLGVVSNCFAEDVVAWPRCSLARYFDCSLYSFEAGVAKPDPVIYLEATRRLQVDVRHTLFIGDGADDEFAGARQAGLRAYRARWFRRRWPTFREEQCAVMSLVSVDQVSNLVEQANLAVENPGLPLKPGGG
jgi:putative hydrolase of the HAD superfamily